MATPLEMPPYIGSRMFDLMNVQQLSPTGQNGFIQTLQRASPFWQAQYTTGMLSEEKWQDMITFFDQLDGAMNTFLAYDPRRPMPYAYNSQPLTSDPWTQTGQTAPRITAYNYSASTINLDRLQNGAVITRGDYISVQVNLVWYLFRSQADVVVASNQALGLVVRPRPNFDASFVATNIRYRRACAEMKMIGQPQETDSVDSLPTFTFKAAQYIARAPT